MSRCKTCGAAVRWETTVYGKPIPLDAEQVPLGRLFINSEGKVQAWSEEVGRSVPRFETHFASCPDADLHRRP